MNVPFFAASPADLPTGPDGTFEFLALYFVLGLAGVAVANFIGNTVTAWASQPRASARTHLFAMDALPSDDAILAVAYLAGGRERVAATIRAWAIAAHWVVSTGDGRWVLRKLHASAPEWALYFTRRLSIGRIDRALVDASAKHAAELVEHKLLRELQTEGLWRSGSARGAGALALLISASWVLAIGAWRALRPGTPTLDMLLVGGETGLFAVAALGLTTQIAKRSDLGDKYLRWIDGATEGLRRDVARKRIKKPDLVALARAIDG